MYISAQLVQVWYFPIRCSQNACGANSVLMKFNAKRKCFYKSHKSMSLNMSFVKPQPCHLYIFWIKVSISCSKRKQSLWILCIMCKCTHGRACLSIRPSIHVTSQDQLSGFSLHFMCTLWHCTGHLKGFTVKQPVMCGRHKPQKGAKLAPPILGSSSDIWQ